jgi:Zn-dependent peptidase ImmA (M78 family)
MAFPELVTSARAGGRVLFRWTPDVVHLPGVPVRFLQSGEVVVPREEAEGFLAGQLLEPIARRLDGGSDPRATSFASAWRTQMAMNAHERRSRVLLARLGLDEGDPLAGDLAGWLAGLARHGLNPILDALLDAAEPASVKADQPWAEEVWRVCEGAPAIPSRLRVLRDRVGAREANRDSAPMEAPWKVGWRRAALLREATGWKTTEFSPPATQLTSVLKEACALDASRFAMVDTLDDPAIDGAVAWSRGKSPTVVFARKWSQKARLFRMARELHGILFEGAPDEPFARIASAYLPGDLSRANAFAAELLAPMEAVRRLLHGQGCVGDDVLREVASVLRVSPQVVRHQIENHHLAVMIEE